MKPTRFGLYLPNFGELAKPDNMIKLARLAEENGWEGIFLWDHIPVDPSMVTYDPWILLTLVAANTEKLRLGTTVTPLARRRPQKIAKEIVTLDHLSKGRVTLGIGLGNEKEFVSYGEPFKPREVAEKLDECVEILRLLWSGEPVDYKGKHYRIKAQHLPIPVQKQIPIWVGGNWPNKAPFRRAAKHQGVFPLKRDSYDGLTPEEHVAVLEYIKKHGGNLADYDVVRSVYSQGDPEKDKWMKPYKEAGVNWFLDCLDPWRGKDENLFDRVKRGPPEI
jgi:alkanesulfonate monooxygenase SsuD/methylene tetrahydromethanopterin reductase-like flavin-dependent oxidoreductase (luciferase family)